MQKLFRSFRVSVLYTASLLLVAGYPLTTMAESTDAAVAGSSVPTTVQPTSTDNTAATTTPTTPSTSDTPSTTSATPASGSTQAAGTTPSTSTTQTQPTVEVVQPTAQPAQVAPSDQVAAPATSSTTQSQTTPTTTSAINDTTKAAITNGLDSTAQSGDAAVKNNTTTANTTTGDATAATTIVNSVNSSLTNTNNQKAANFVTNITGDVSGDIILQPLLLKAMLENQTNPTDSTVTVNNASSVTNNLNLNATSGNALVQGNTTTGDTTTGTANTVANVMNIVNSMVGANQSFVGTVNIYGNLNGDILIAPDFIPQLLASNAASPALNQPASGSTTVNASDTQSIVNNVSLAAQSGSALLQGNTTAGNVTTGDANTNVVIFNLSGHQIVASNSLLVFVNVLGKWVGVIVDAPTGATAAAIGNGVTENTTTTPDLTISANNMAAITNNLSLSSQSGNASLINNTKAGNVTTGNATASANIANIIGSQIGLSGWFGILFINVFGSWNGSFGVDTSAGNAPASASTGPASTSGGSSPLSTDGVMQFRPRTIRAMLPLFKTAAPTVITGANTQSPASEQETTTRSEPDAATAVLATTKSVMIPRPMAPTSADFNFNTLIAAGLTVITGIGAVGIKRFF